MVSTFYRRYSIHLIVLVALSFPYVVYQAESLPSNNDIETWLPKQSEVRLAYDQFKRQFGAEELILIGVETTSVDEKLIEAICSRIEALPGIRKCWSPDRLRDQMTELELSKEEIDSHLRGLSVSADGTFIGLIALLSDAGIESRVATVQAVNDQLAYCQVNDDRVNLAGAPVVISELDRLGNAKSNQKFFLATLLICLCLLYGSLRDWRLSLSILGLTVWSIQLTLAIIKLAGGEMNFILGALSVMVMVFTLSIAIHFLHYYAAAMACADPLREALRLAWRPCCLATLTTTIGLVSLTISEFAPVSQFGCYASIGCLVALITGLGLTPAVLTVCPPSDLQMSRSSLVFARLGNRLLERSRRVTLITSCLVGLACIGLLRLESKIDPLDFLPEDSKVLTDVRLIQRNLTNTDSIEAVVDFGTQDLSFVERLDQVRRIESIIRSHSSIQHTMSLASFFPAKMPDSAFATASLLSRARQYQRDNDFIADGDRFWRITGRIDPAAYSAQQQTVVELVAMTSRFPITFTGITPLLESAQQQIFRGFLESFGLAFGIITLVMIASLRSLKAGAIAMVPNLTPILIVFGTMGWIGTPIDIGMMMTGSIALGIAVDGTFHFLVRYQEQYNRMVNSQESVRIALLQTGPPILQATIVASFGMLALTLSSFGPTARFGCLMAATLVAALIGDLVLLPCLLYQRPKIKRSRLRRPYFAKLRRLRPLSGRRRSIAAGFRRQRSKKLAELSS